MKRKPHPTEDEFKAWLTEPVTVFYFDYLKKFRKELIDAWADSFAKGDFSEPELKAIDSGKCIAIEDATTVTLEEIEAFLEYEKESERDSTKEEVNEL